MRFLAAFALLATLFPLCACQSGAMSGTQFGKMTAEQNAMFAKGGPEPKKMSDKELQDVTSLAHELNAKAPALAAASTVGGLDPTGATQSLIFAEQMRQAQKVQEHMPAVMANSRYLAEQYCREKPNDKDCIEIRRLDAQLRRQAR